MKIRPIYILGIAALLGFAACSGDNDEKKFDTRISSDMFSFTPLQGGATLHFNITDPAVTNVRVEYTNEYGETVTKLADLSATTLNLDGFNKPAENVPVRISFLDRNNRISDVVESHFSTEKSNLLSFFDSVKVDPYWDGFRVSYHLTGHVAGSATVFFVGENPATHERDTITLDNFELQEGLTTTHSYMMAENQRQASYTVVLTTEDDAQHVVKREVYDGIRGLTSAVLPNTGFRLLDPFGKSIEDPQVHPADRAPGGLSSRFLFDGDRNGVQAIEYYTTGQTKCVPPFLWVAGPNAYANEEVDCYFVLDAKEPLQVSQMRFYTPWFHPNDMQNTQLGGWYYGNNPCNVVVYGWTGPGDYDVEADKTGQYSDADWKQLGTFQQDRYALWADRWYFDQQNNSYGSTTFRTKADYEKAASKFFDVVFEFDGKSYRYFKLKFLDHFSFKQGVNGYAMQENNTNLLMLSEIDVFANSSK